MEKPVFDPAFLQELADNAPRGLSVTPEEVQAWFDEVWLRFKQRRYRNIKRAVVSWWSRATPQDLEIARERLENVDDPEIEAAAAALRREASSQPMRDFFSEVGR